VLAASATLLNFTPACDFRTTHFGRSCAIYGLGAPKPIKFWSRLWAACTAGVLTVKRRAPPLPPDDDHYAAAASEAEAAAALVAAAAQAVGTANDIASGSQAEVRTCHGKPRGLHM
jgi:hypothetical protein